MRTITLNAKEYSVLDGIDYLVWHSEEADLSDFSHFRYEALYHYMSAEMTKNQVKGYLSSLMRKGFISKGKALYRRGTPYFKKGKLIYKPRNGIWYDAEYNNRKDIEIKQVIYEIK